MESPANDVARYLAAQGIGTFAGTSDWGVYAHVEPESPNNCITVYDTGGSGPDTDEQDLGQPEFQVRVRCVEYSDGYAKQVAIRDLLILGGPITMASSTFVLVDMTSDVIPLGRDDSNRFLLTANYRTIRELS